MTLLMSDQLIRKLLSPFIPEHATKRHLSVINVGDAKFFRLGNHHHQIPPKSTRSFENEKGFKRPQYSLSIAHTLCIASKLAYEDVDVVKYELEQAGYLNSFKPIGYKNVCAYVIEKENDVFLVFRGTNPLNIQNYVTNLDAGLTDISSPTQGWMGKVHKGFWDAMGSTSAQAEQRIDEPTLSLQLSHTSLSQTIAAAVKAILQIIKMVSVNVFQNVTDPIDAGWVTTSEVRYHSLYSQAENWILKVMQENEKKRLYITGHSLGGALATVFLAKMIQSSSPLVGCFEGLYTFGQPNIGDENFGKAFSPEIACKIFNHTYNNDVVPRIPYWYSPPPGTLVFIDASYKITLYPPDPKTGQPVPVRPISYLHPSGLLNKSVIGRLRQEASVRILFRLLLPFFINDHFPSDYSDALLSGDVEWIVVGEEEGGNEERDENMKRYSLHQ
ncbi:hypothetical protein G6F37_009602 [Rhizopus arrhizus]|nr:hypothetical protein G6F38_010869 [Rhizopus arrhizus]KAG1154271.1 hypothetical protein G6F37_009602 [Rhizopus arrhizus]